MTRLILLFVLALLLFSCDKEDMLEGTDLPYNNYDDPDKSYVTVTDVREINCTTVGFIVNVNTDLIPKDVQKRGYKIEVEDPFGVIFYAGTVREQTVKAKCGANNIYKIVITQLTTFYESKPYFFSIETTD